MEIYNVREIKEKKEEIFEYFWRKWGYEKNRMFYRDCIERSIDTESDLPRFFVALEEDKIIGSYAILRSDLNSRQDLYPWFACLYVEEEQRGRNLGAMLQQHAKAYMKSKGFDKLYLCTDMNDYYEKNDWIDIGIGYSIGDDLYKIYEASF